MHCTVSILFFIQLDCFQSSAKHGSHGSPSVVQWQRVGRRESVVHWLAGDIATATRRRERRRASEMGLRFDTRLTLSIQQHADRQRYSNRTRDNSCRTNRISEITAANRANICSYLVNYEALSQPVRVSMSNLGERCIDRLFVGLHCCDFEYERSARRGARVSRLCPGDARQVSACEDRTRLSFHLRDRQT